MAGVFDRFAPFVQDFVYANDWESLRAIQVAAAEAIFDTDCNVLLTSSTASGKTEAAFFPVLTLLDQDPPKTVGALYIGPLKALINDQFYRLQDLCDQGGIPVWHWHGDVSSSHKDRLLKKPSGILQITPESLEALLLHKHSMVSRLFGDLRFVVVDELHALIRGDRGLQTLCLIQRMCRLAGCNPRRIGLSATLGDAHAAAALLEAGSGRSTVVPQVVEPGIRWRLAMEHFYITGPQAAEQVGADQGDAGASAPQPALPGLTLPLGCGEGRPADSADEAGSSCGKKDALLVHAAPMPSDPAPVQADPGLAYVYEHSAGRKCLVFSNSREECEAVTSTLRSYCEVAGVPDRFLIHHGNLSSSLRQTAEDFMRDETLDYTVCTTATLELGIDIGRLERAFQMDAPFTVSSFLQRMGRTGRRGQPPEMRFVIREDSPEPRSLVPETVPWKLLQGIALVQLYLEERWVEPPRMGRLPYSLLYHQTLATLAGSGEMTPAALAGRVLSLAPFANIPQEDFRILLLHLIERGHIERTEGGGLIVGLAGERVVNNYRFYGVFVESEEYTVRCDSIELGTVVAPPPVGEKLAIAGEVWLVEAVDHRRRLVYCVRVKGKVPAYFGDCPGDIHTRILERMRNVLLEDALYPYLQENAAARLLHARSVARLAGIGRIPLVNLGGDTWVLFPWLGSYAFLALERIIKLRLPATLGVKGVDSSRPYYIQFRMAAAPEEFLDALAQAALADFDPLDLVYAGEVPVFEKYDEYVPDELVRKGFACGVLDVEGVRAAVGRWQAAQRSGAGMMNVVAGGSR